MPSVKSLREEGAVLVAQDENNIGQRGAFFPFGGREKERKRVSPDLTLFVACVRSQSVN